MGRLLGHRPDARRRGPGAGPVCAVSELEPFLPVPRAIKEGDRYALVADAADTIGRVHAFNGNYSVLIRAYSYILSMGPDNLKKASQLAVLNAAYIRERLRDTFALAYDRPCMHECVFSDARQLPFKITTLDMAKRLIDHGYHPPTIYFPLVVSGAIMIEPTETECKDDLDSFIDNEESDGCGEFPKFAKSVVPRVKFRGLLSDITAHSTQMSPPTLVGSRLKGTS